MRSGMRQECAPSRPPTPTRESTGVYELLGAAYDIELNHCVEAIK